MDPIDLRSDTVTRPTDAMRRAMAEAVVGDDVFGEDPTVARLEEASARGMGMEAALLVPTGTMGNQTAVWVHTRRGGQALVEENCHIALYEGGGASLLSGVSLRTMRAQAGVFGPDDMTPHWTPDDPHFVPTRLVSLENTHNWSGGRCWRPEQVRAVVDVAHERGVPVHIDGARIHNAAVALGTTPDRLVQGADSVMFCLSKSLSAPIGSVLCGSEAFVEQARHVRKTLGGGMRQAGHIAAAGLEALRMADRLAEDHRNARLLAVGLRDVPGLDVDLAQVETNMVLADVSGTGLSSEAFCARAAWAGVLCLPRDLGPTVRFVTHRNVTADAVQEAVVRLRQA